MSPPRISLRNFEVTLEQRTVMEPSKEQSIRLISRKRRPYLGSASANTTTEKPTHER